MSKFSDALKSVNVTRENKPVELVDIYDEPIGLEVTIGPRSSKRYHAAERRFQDRLGSGRKVSAKQKAEMFDELHLARVESWRFYGRLESLGQPELNTPNLKDFFIESGEDGRSLFIQLKAAISDYDENFPED